MSNYAELALIKEASKEWLMAQSPPNILTAKEMAHRKEKIAQELTRLRFAYPIQSRNYSEVEMEITNILWCEIFLPVEPILLHEAIMRFIINDRKSFFPSPGQIVGYVEQIIGEKLKEQERIRSERHWAQVRANEERIANGEHCGTCKYCRQEFMAPSCGDENYPQWQWARTEEERLKLRIEKLFCENPKGSNYEGEHSHGTSRVIRCEHYKRQGNIQFLPQRQEAVS